MQVDFIVCSDIHYRATKPEARTDEFFKEQQNKILFIKKMQKKYDCPVLCAGDVFDHWRTSPEFEAWAIKNWPNNFIVT